MGDASRWDDTVLSVQCRQRHAVHVDMEPGHMLSRKYCKVEAEGGWVDGDRSDPSEIIDCSRF